MTRREQLSESTENQFRNPPRIPIDISGKCGSMECVAGRYLASGAKLASRRGIAMNYSPPKTQPADIRGDVPEIRRAADLVLGSLKLAGRLVPPPIHKWLTTLDPADYEAAAASWSSWKASEQRDKRSRVVVGHIKQAVAIWAHCGFSPELIWLRVIPDANQVVRTSASIGSDYESQCAREAAQKRFDALVGELVDSSAGELVSGCRDS